MPSATEMVCFVGAQEQLVGRSHECDYPPAILDRPVVSRARLSMDPDSLAIDRSIRSMVAETLSIYHLDLDALQELSFDLVLTQDLCKVCALSFDDVEQALRDLRRSEVKIVRLHPTRLQDIFQDLSRIAEAAGRQKEGQATLADLKTRMARIEAKVKEIELRPKVVTIEWLEPTLLGGTWMPEMIQLAGGIPLGAEAGQLSPQLSHAELADLQPDVLVLKPCGFSLQRSRKELADLPRLLPWDRWPAVAAGRVYLADGNAYFNRSGPRILDSLEILAACLHPESFPEFRHSYADSVVRLDADLQEYRFDDDFAWS
ncbi:MAG: cobalamin-binding protein [Planctomycetota bacterium]|nr:MAG: cobalamin-binding protein [Planctomycetota bacterium]